MRLCGSYHLARRPSVTDELNYNINGYNYDFKSFANLMGKYACILVSILKFFLTLVLLP